MAIAYPTTLYGCRWRCGSRRSEKRKLVEKHEETCFKNPARRACKTCKHDHKEPDPDGCWCEKDARAYAGIEPTTLTCRADCPEWEAKAALTPTENKEGM